MRKHLVSLLLALMLVFSLAGTAYAAAAPEELFQADSMWNTFPSIWDLDSESHEVYNYTPKGNWVFEIASTSAWNFKAQENLYYIPNDGYWAWGIASGITQTGDIYWVSPHFLVSYAYWHRIMLCGDNLAAGVYTAPATGTVSIDSESALETWMWDGGPNGVRFAIYKSDLETGKLSRIWPTDKDWLLLGGSTGVGSYTFEPFETDVEEGQKLYFILDPNKDAKDDTAFWDPTVTYTKLTDYSTKLVIPADTTVIEEEAFMDCTTLGGFSVAGSNLTEIQSGAFKNCTWLCFAYIPDSVTIIADDAFEGCSKVHFYCSDTSAAAAYADAHGIEHSEP